MGDSGAPDPQALEAALGIYRAIAQAQSRWQEVAAAIAADAPLPLEDLTPDQERAVMNLELRHLTPQSRADVRYQIATLEAVLRGQRAGADGVDGARASADEPGTDGPPRTVPGHARWFAYAPRSGTVFLPRNDSSTTDRSRAAPDRHAIRLMNDYGADWPLWTSPTVAADEVMALLDDELSARLRHWARVFNSHFDHVEGWDDTAVAAEHRAEAERLIAALRATLPSPWHVRLEYWETNGTDR
jgi:hypothetical protein